MESPEIEEVEALTLTTSNSIVSPGGGPPVMIEDARKVLSCDEISRYSRQMILFEMQGPAGQIKLKNGSALIVGVGGLGSPAAMYLASAGIGTLGLVDYDVVEKSNLHRQVIHGERTLNISKCESAKLFIENLNPNVQVRTFKEPFNNTNALEIVKQFDIVLDCTDNAATRYLLNDACVLSKKILISGSALRWEGQLTTYNCGGAPCYRCVFPIPPPPEFVTNCSDGGVMGAVPGIIGTIQALEAIKIITNTGANYANKLLLFDAIKGTFTNVTLRAKQKNCAVCGVKPTITELLDDYALFCGSGFDDKEKGVQLLGPEDRITPLEYDKVVKGLTQNTVSSHVLVDVRDFLEVKICSLPNTLNVPMSRMHSKIMMDGLTHVLEKKCRKSKEKPLPVYVICRRGNDSQKAVQIFRKKYESSPTLADGVIFKDIIGGLHRWARDVDNSFPVY